MLKNQNRGAKDVGLVILMKLGTIGQILLMMMGFYYVWIQDIHQGALMFLLAVAFWTLKIQTKERLFKQVQGVR